MTDHPAFEFIDRFGDHPARRAAARSMRHAGRGEREEWLALFTEDAHVADPVGPSPLDPSGKGHRGIEAIGAFWDANIGPNKLRFQIDESHAAGNECANVGAILTTLGDGSTVRTRGVYLYRVDDAGLLTSLRAYWQFDDVEFVPSAD